MAKIAVIGEGVIDRFIEGQTFKDVIGGSGLNTAVAMKRAGADAVWFTRTASDQNGKTLSNYARTEGVLSSACPAGAEPASQVLVYLSPTGQPRYEFALEGAVDWQWSDAELAPLRTDFEVIQIGSLSAVLDPGASKIYQLLKDLKNENNSPLITYDPNARPSAALSPSHALEMKNRINEMVKIADLVKVSDEDLAWLTPKSTPEETAKAWSLDGPKLVVVTRGAAGAVAFINGKQIAAVAGQNVDVVDTVGAGDTFMAWLVYQIAGNFDCKIPTNSESITSLLELASKAAAITCSREGCKPPFAKEVF